MTGQSFSRHPAKFVVLTDLDSVTNAKRNYFTWIISVTVFFGVMAGFLCYKMILAPIYFNDGLPQLPGDNNDSFVTRATESSVRNLLRPAFRKNIGKERSEFICEKPEIKLEAIPLPFRKRAFERSHFESLHDNINADLLTHYEITMNEYSTKHLKSIFNEHQLKLSAVRHSDDFVNFLGGLKSNKFKFYTRYLKRHKFELKIEDFDWFFALTEELNQWYNYLDRLRDFMSDFDQQSRRNSFGIVTELNFATFTEETFEKIFHFVYPFNPTEKKLEEINEIINEWTMPTQVNFSNRSVTLLNRAVLLSEVKEQLHAFNTSFVKNVYVFASRIVYLDVHLELVGLNLGIVSPNWKFLKKIKINLDGAVGEAHAVDTAGTGQDGKPGNPGGNGGDFLGVGTFQEELLHVSANGGMGGPGQNGARGRDGVDNTRPQPRFNKPGCIIQVKKFKNLLPLKMTHYEIYGEEGCGGPGTDGGIGGQGGQGGVITLIRRNSVKVTKGLVGATGRPGRGGAGGTGGQNGCFYEAVDENDEFLHPVTTIKCPAGTTLPSGQSGKDNHNSRGQISPPLKENLTVHDCIFQYIRLTREHLVKYLDPQVILFLKELNIYEGTGLEDMLKTFKLIEGFDRLEYYKFFREKLFEYSRKAENKNTREVFNYLKSILLGEIIYFQRNINYFFIDMENYFNILKTSLTSTNENTRELQAVSYFARKVEIKIEEIKNNLNLLKLKVQLGNERNYPSEAPKEKRLLCVITIIIDFINCLTYGPNDLSHLELKESLTLCEVTVEPVSKSPRQDPVSVENNFADVEKVLLRALKALFFEKEPAMAEHLANLGDALDILKGSGMLREEEEPLLGALMNELEHFAALYYFFEWRDLADSFSTSLKNLTANESPNSSWSEEMEFLKGRLLNVMIAVQFKLAEDASRQKFYPPPKTNALQLPWKKTLSDVLSELNILRDSRDQSPFCKNHMKAVFERNGTMGEFFYWPNSEVRNKLKALFSGAEINLKSNLINRHVLDKNFLQFASLRLDFDCLEGESACDELRNILVNFKIDVTHSGYSYYNWGDKTHVVVSEKVTLSYNFKTRDNREPELYNAFFKKCQDGEIKLSPFTTWTVGLFPLNEAANFSELEPFADVVGLYLIGTGTYTN